MIKAYCLSCGSANNYVNGIKPTICSRCKKSLTQKATVVAAYQPPVVVQPAVQQVARPVARPVSRIAPSKPTFASYDIDEENDSDLDLSVLSLNSSDISYELDLQETSRKFTLGDAIDSPVRPPTREKGKKISKAAMKKNLKGIMDSQKSSKGRSE